MSYKGKFTPTNPQKYKGNWNNITYRSLWELSYMRLLDSSDIVERWNSEEVVIPYISRADGGKRRRYFMDFWFKRIDGKEFLIEVKPFKETLPPQKPKRKTAKAMERYEKELYTYIVNRDKWDAAADHAQKLGWDFRILTEKSLKQLGLNSR
ncbi:head closure [Vibrio phage EniLVp02]